MTVEIITNWPQLAALKTAWNELAGGMPFCSWDWLATWWRHYGSAPQGAADSSEQSNSGRQLYVLAVYGDPLGGCGGRELLGIAPWHLDRTVVKGNVVRWLGSGEVCTDHLSLVCRPEHRDRVVELVAETLTATCDDWDRLELSAVDADDDAIASLAGALEARDCLVSRQPADACWAVELPLSWDEYLATISKSHRKQLRQLERRVLETDRAVWHRVTSFGELEAAWPVLVELHQRRRRSLNEPGCFASQTFHDFHREVAARLLDRGQLRASWLELDGTPAAAEYHLADSAATYAYQGGVDPDRLDDEPGRLSSIRCLQLAIEEGHQRFDFLRGDEPYKAHWRATPRQTFDYRVVSNRRGAKLRGRVLNLTSAVADWVRQSASPCIK
jgi:CelD/BcsL family acetyltransferase involved in cellulose biosynthesis